MVTALTTSRNFELLKWFNFTLGFSPFAIIAVLYFEHVTNSYALAMSLFAVASFTTTLLEIPTGVISDYLGRKNTLIAGLLATLFSLIMYAIAPSFLILAIGAVFEGVAYSLYSGNNDALLFESLKENGKEAEYAGSQGKISSLSSASGAVAALASGFIASISFVYLPWISVFFVAIALVIALFIVEPRSHSEKIKTNVFFHVWDALMQFKNNVQLRNLSLSSTLDWGLGGSASMFRPAFVAALWPIWAVGIFNVGGHIAYGVSSWYAGKILSKLGNEWSLLWGSVAKSTIRIVAYGFPSAASPALIAGENLIVAPMHNAQDALMHGEYTEPQRATMASLNSLMGNLFFGICCIAMGYLADQVGGAHALLVSELLCLPIILLYVLIIKNRRVPKHI